MTTRRALELFSGLGGLRFAAPPGFEIVASYDQDRDAADCHELNHGLPVHRRNLAGVDADTLRAHEAEAWFLSPPCQPFTRRGKGRDLDDPRCAALLNLISLLPQCRPRILFVENVPGFHGSRAHALLKGTLDRLGHELRDVAACPSELGLPLRRPRQFLLSSRDGLGTPLAPERQEGSSLASFLDDSPDESLFVPPELRARVEDHLPMVGPDGLLGTFTRSYGRALSGAGPVLFEERGPRWFSPREILRLHDFPSDFRFPEALPRRSRWRLAGNSLHVRSVRHVASGLLAA